MLCSIPGPFLEWTTNSQSVVWSSNSSQCFIQWFLGKWTYRFVICPLQEILRVIFHLLIHFVCSFHFFFILFAYSLCLLVFILFIVPLIPIIHNFFIFHLQVFPPEILGLHKLVSLRLRNNPIKEIPHGNT